MIPGGDTNSLILRRDPAECLIPLSCLYHDCGPLRNRRNYPREEVAAALGARLQIGAMTRMQGQCSFRPRKWADLGAIAKGYAVEKMRKSFAPLECPFPH